MVRRKKILIVDDSSTVRLMHTTLLAGRYDVVTAQNGLEALKTATSTKPDLIFMDVMMPEMTGLQACKALRAIPGFEKVPIILVTTLGAANDVEAGYAAGCTAYMTKPFNRAELDEQLRTHLGETRPPG